MVVCRIAFFLLLLFPTALFGQGDRYMVFFKDKAGSSYSISQPSQFLSAKAIARRSKNAMAVTTDDIPVNASYVSQVKSVPGVTAFFTSRWVNALLVEASPAAISSVQSLPIVLRVEKVAPGNRLIGGRVKQLKQKNATDAPGLTQTQLEMLGMNTMHADNIRGEGVTISVFDSGFPGVNSVAAFQPVMSSNRVILTKDFIRNSSNVYQYDSHGTEVFSVIAAQLQGTFLGGAFNADYMLFVTEDAASEYKIEEYNWLFAAERADSAGTDVIQSSLGYFEFDDPTMNYVKANLDGKTAVVSKAASMARDRGIVVVVSAGNEGNNGWGLVTFPADVDGILAVGAVSPAGVKTAFSSVGPTADNRIKPDVVALGQSTVVIRQTGTTGTASGTSLAAPLVASLAAGILQTYPALTSKQVIDAIRLSADKGNSPDNRLGYGLPNYVAVRNYLESNQSGEDIYIYPNPTDSILQIAFKDIQQSPVELTFYDLQGKVISDQQGVLNWLVNPVEISVRNLDKGMYLLRVKTSTTTKTFRFIKL